jgi:hypothetical protein
MLNPKLTAEELVKVFYETVYIKVNTPLFGDIEAPALRCRQCHYIVTESILELHICNSFLN